MIASFRRLTKSMVGSIIMVLFFVAILAGFALQDIQGVVGLGGGLSKTTLAKAGGEELTEREFSAALQRRLGARCRVVPKSAVSGRLEIEYTSLDELDGILGKIGA